MAKILAISSQVVFGPVGLNAIVPALQAEGHDVQALPTVLLSNHPGHGKPTGVVHDLEPIILALENIGAFADLDAIITGYFANVGQIQCVAKLVQKLNPKIILIDPVLGDHGKLYVPTPVAEAIRDELLPIATICTPNAFELSWLTGHRIEGINEATEAARTLNVAEVIVTSVPADVNLATLSVSENDRMIVQNPKQEHVPNGTGDMLSGLYLARQFGPNAKSALADALVILQAAIKLSGKTNILAVAPALHNFEKHHD